MLKSFKEAQALFEKHDYEAAYSIFLDRARSSEFDVSERIDSYKYAIKCKKQSSHYSDLSSISFELIKLLYAQENFPQILEYFQFIKHLGEQESYQLHEIMWSTYIALGEVQKSEKYAQKSLELLFRKGDTNQLGQQASKMEELGLSRAIVKQSKYMLSFMRGDEDRLVEQIEEDLKSLYSKKRDRSILSIRKVVSLMPPSQRRRWHKKSGHKSLLAWINMQEDHISHSTLKETALLIFEFTIYNKSHFLDTILIASYTQRAKRFDFADLISKKYEKNKSYPYLNKLIRKIEQEMIDYDELPTEFKEDVDYATDLFRLENINAYDNTGKISKLEKQISLLKEEGHKEKAEQLTKELEKLDSSHDLVKDLHEKKLFEQASRRLQKHKEIDSLRDDLLREIKFFSIESFEEEEILTKSVLQKSIEYLDDETFKEAIRDIAVACLELDFPDMAERVLDDPRGEGEGSREEWYIRVSCLLKKGESYKAVDYIDEYILNTSLSLEEEICFMYMKAEALRLQGKSLEALKTYKKVSELNPRYRLVQLRLKEDV